MDTSVSQRLAGLGLGAGAGLVRRGQRKGQSAVNRAPVRTDSRGTWSRTVTRNHVSLLDNYVYSHPPIPKDVDFKWMRNASHILELIWQRLEKFFSFGYF